ncbi:MAG: type II secretion system protein [Candidatus Omnitrophota bacterium]
MLRTKKGFTLIEMMIVIAIIALLATIAIPNYLGFRTKAMTAEAKSNLGTLRTLEEAYSAEYQDYLDCDQYPAAVPAATTYTWNDAAAATVDSDWTTLGYSVKGAARYAYEVVRGSATTFDAKAYGDLDGDATLSTYNIDETGAITETNPLE